jgi:hypothetical protein
MNMLFVCVLVAMAGCCVGAVPRGCARVAPAGCLCGRPLWRPQGKGNTGECRRAPCARPRNFAVFPGSVGVESTGGSVFPVPGDSAASDAWWG